MNNYNLQDGSTKYGYTDTDKKTNEQVHLTKDGQTTRILLVTCNKSKFQTTAFYFELF